MTERIKITFMPHETVCPGGAVIEVAPGTNLCRAALNNAIAVEHACELACACTTCHVHIREGAESLEAASELEEDMLDKAWGLDADSRLSCQVAVADSNLVIEIPKYTINMVSEQH